MEIGDCCFLKAVTFEIIGLNELKHVKIGKNSFTYVDSFDYENDSKKAIKDACNYYWTFRILNCKSLESIEIGQFSFFDYGGNFELRNLPALQLLNFGLHTTPSGHFCFSSFVIRGYYLLWNIIVDLSSLRTNRITYGFCASLSTVIESNEYRGLGPFE